MVTELESPPITQTAAEPRPEAQAKTATGPLGEIALSFSGGGYRATAFHLGVLDMLNELKLLPDIRALSTVSGGTFTGLMFAVWVAESENLDNFADGFRAKLETFLQETNVINLAFANIAQQKRRPSLIRAAAQIYASEGMLGEHKFALLLNSDKPQLAELAFNATEFTGGNSFRFVKSRNPKAVIGTNDYRLEKEVAEKIRLADIAAASSCFPGAFEPLRYPQDFHDADKLIKETKAQRIIKAQAWRDNRTESLTKAEEWLKTAPPEQTAAAEAQVVAAKEQLAQAETNLAEARKLHKVQEIDLMDGGIYDNQGFYSINLIYSRENAPPPGLYIMSDTSPRTRHIFQFPKAQPKSWFRITLDKLVPLYWLLCLGSIIIAATSLYNWYNSYAVPRNAGWHLDPFVLYGLPFLVAVVVLGLLWKVRGLFKDLLEKAQAEAEVDLWPYIKNLSQTELVDLGMSRASSTLKLTSTIFMKRIRGMVQKEVVDFKPLKGHYQFALIYHLAEIGVKPPDSLPEWLRPNLRLQKLSKAAEDVATKLWFTEKEVMQMKDVIECGRATLCFNLLRYLLAKHTETDLLNTAFASVYADAKAAWMKLNV